METEQLCRIVIDNASDAVLFSDSKGIIRLWNSGAERMFGYRREEALGKSLDLIIPENLRQRHWDGYFRVMASGTSRYSVELLSAPALCKDGSRISTEFSLVLVTDTAGQVQGVAAIIRDVTARWQREREQKERMRELESLLKNAVPG
ncbi:PAS domain S-box protein [Geobacter sp. FeAm09]|uniref:PAS domain-containing protein n=1 Tax=Geobacter sp. FeAm09 TaxID=2597769 RepID=UPI0011EBA61A|nr:PAS domain S-box protein [Geobacter sp. FeAm09]QEM68701.1 PAS domain S-box protein [Geobacter sp. FeAm09]